MTKKGREGGGECHGGRPCAGSRRGGSRTSSTRAGLSAFNPPLTQPQHSAYTPKKSSQTPAEPSERARGQG